MANSVADLIRAARNGRTQAEFATVLGVSQSQLSRYERGKYDPPARVINACMREAHIGNGMSVPSADDLAQRVRMTLASPDKEQARSAIASLLAVFAHE
ncbi:MULTISPECIES: helix-turn-helix transcriptional regulator [Pseudomonadota]|uniref:helix-turn-helix transcriptional regulator n=1 Tax=Pseudomonadota TaxID=1224 RepID=UPI0005FAC489|nr:helix-turn-helix transcriptional regulator [Paracidovorax citrulli]